MWGSVLITADLDDIYTEYMYKLSNSFTKYDMYVYKHIADVKKIIKRN